MLKLYEIEQTINLDNHSCFNNESSYPKFQEDLIKYKNLISDLTNNNRGVTFYKFGDGDGRFLRAESVGSARPGQRALSKSYSEIDIEEHRRGAQLCDYYTCEIYPENRRWFRQLIHREIDFPAEYGYGLVGNKWYTETFGGSIGLIGAGPKLELIQQLLEYDEYKEYLKIDKFEDYIEFPQKFAADDLTKLEQFLKPQLEKSTSKIFLLGIGHAKSGILYRFTNYKSAVYMDVGAGIDMFAGCINTRRPYAGNWTNFRLSNFDYSRIDYLNYNRGNERLLK
jgi:hypothetical protein